MRSLKEIEVNSYYGAKFSLSFMGNYKNGLKLCVVRGYIGEDCGNSFVYNVLEQTEPFYSMGNA